MLISPSYFPHKKLSPRSLDAETQLRNTRQLEQVERDTKKDEKNGVKTQHIVYKTLADNDNAEAQYRIAEILLEEGNSPEAFAYMKLAARQMHRTAQCRLGEMYAHGIGVEKDETEAIKWFIKAEDASPDHSCARALIYLGAMLSLGRGTVPDTRAGSAHLLQAERSYLSQNQGGEISFGKDVGPDAFYLKPAKVLPTALYLLSENYFFRNKEEEGVRYQKQAADAGHPLSRLAVQKKLTHITEIDLNLLKSDASDGCSDTSFFLGQLYSGAGNLIERNSVAAKYYFNLAAKAGHSEAKAKLNQSASIELNDFSSLAFAKSIPKAGLI